MAIVLGGVLLFVVIAGPLFGAESRPAWRNVDRKPSFRMVGSMRPEDWPPSCKSDADLGRSAHLLPQPDGFRGLRPVHPESVPHGESIADFRHSAKGVAAAAPLPLSST